MMKNKLFPLILISLFATPALAEKPEFAGKGKPTEEQLNAHKAAMEAKEDLDDDGQVKKERIKAKEKKQKQEMNETGEMKEGSEKMNAMEKQAAKKSEQNRNELGKGSEQGQESREANSKKWWKFWGE